MKPSSAREQTDGEEILRSSVTPIWPRRPGGDRPLGNEVSCRVLIGLVEMAERAGIPRDKLLHGFRHSPAHIMEPRNRTDFTTAMEMMRRVRHEAGSQERFLEIGMRYGQEPAHGYIQWFVAAIFSPMDFYTYPERLFLRMIMGPCVEWEWKIKGSREIEVTYSSDDRHPVCQEFWDFHISCFAKLPNMIGLPDASVELLGSSPHHGVYRIIVPPSGTIWAKTLRIIRGQPLPPSPQAEPSASAPPVAAFAPSGVSPGTVGQGKNEVSCRVVIGLVELAEAAGIPRTKILEGFAHTPAYLMEARNRTDWATAHGVLLRIRQAAGSMEAFIKVADRYGTTPAYSYFKHIVATFISPVHLFTYPNAVVQKLQFGPVLGYHWKRTGPREIEYTYAMGEGYVGSQELWEFNRACMATLPHLLGLPRAVIEILSWTPTTYTARAILPPSGTLLARTQRFFQMHRSSPDPAFSIFAQQHEDLRHSYEVLNKTEAERAELARALLQVADGEREQFARDIHDGLGQELFALRLQADGLKSLDGEELRARAAQLSDLAVKAQKLARSLARGYDPIVGAGGHFSDAVHMLTSRYDREHFDLSALVDVPASAPQATHLYRIVQEAVTNAIRHGGATSLRIAVQPGQPLWRLIVEDNGSGFEPATALHGMGLRAMRYRAAHLGGQFQLERRPEGGMRAICEFQPGPASIS